MVKERALNMKNRTFVLVVANIIVATYIFFNSEEEQSSGLNFQTLVFQNLTELDTLKIINPEDRNSTFLFKKINGDWKINEPIKWPVDKLNLSNFLTTFSHLEAGLLIYTSELESRGELLGDYGFDHNSSRVELSEGANVLELIVGNNTRDKNFVYLLTKSKNKQEDGIIWKVSANIKEYLEIELSHWATPHFIRFPLYSIDEITEAYNSELSSRKTTLTRSKNEWVFTLPFSAKANVERVNALLNQLVTEKVTKFYVSPPNLENEKYFLSLSVHGLKRVQTIKFYECNVSGEIDFIAKSSENDIFFGVSNSFLEILNKWPQKLRERKLFSLNLETVKRVKISSHQSSISLRQNDQKSWIGLDDNGSKNVSFVADEDAISKLFQKLNTIEVTDFLNFNPTSLELEAIGLDNPTHQLEIEYKDTTRQNLLFSRSNNESSYLKTFVTEQALICLVNQHCEEILTLKPLEFRKKSLIPTGFLPNQIIFSSLEKAVNPSLLNLKENGESFERLMGFKADRFLDSKPEQDGAWIDGNWVPWTLLIKFKNAEQDNPQTVQFLLSDRFGATTWYAGSLEEDIVFTLPIHLIDELNKIQPSSLTQEF